MSGSVRWGILGAGSMATRFARDLSHTPHGHLVAVASRDPERAARLVSEPGLAEARVVADYAALAADDAIDAIYIATPTHLHRDHALLAIAGGKAVLCEKPLAASVEDARAIADAAHSAGVFCMEALWTRFLPSVQAFERRIETLGPLRHVTAHLGMPRLARVGDPVTDERLGGGALTDLGVYPLALATALVGPLQLLSGHVRRGHGAVETIRHAEALLSANDGDTMVTVAASHCTRLSNRFEIAGEAGRLTIDTPFIEALGFRHISISPEDHRAGDGSGRVSRTLRGSRLWPILRGARRQLRHPDGTRSSHPYRGTGLQFQAEEVARCLDRNLVESPVFPMATSLDVQNLIERIAVTNRER